MLGTVASVPMALTRSLGPRVAGGGLLLLLRGSLVRVCADVFMTRMLLHKRRGPPRHTQTHRGQLSSLIVEMMTCTARAYSTCAPKQSARCYIPLLVALEYVIFLRYFR